MAFLTQRILRGLIPATLSSDRPPARRKRPDRIVLGVRPGHRPSAKAPVRIYLGTERGQFRAERTFLWSVEKHRNPGRIYEIYLLRDLIGFRRRFWLTGFTNYRFAIPWYAGFSGRAIYNDADQVYLTDPATLFDLDMDQAGFLSINDRDTSVMLIDCQRMAEAWNEAAVCRLSRKQLEARARDAGLWGRLDGGWNSRDKEYQAGESKLVHFTTLHTQPWRPFPDQFVYYDNPTGQLWPDLEREADQAGFMPVSATRPSRDWPDVALYLSSRPDGQELATLLTPVPDRPVRQPRCFQGLLEAIPDQDVPWVIDRLFAASTRLELTVREPRWHGKGRHRRSPWFWQQQLEQAGRRHPETEWRLLHVDGLRRCRLWGGPAAAGDIVVLTHRKPGHSNQARAVAQALGRASNRPVRELPITISEAGFVLRRLFGLNTGPALPDSAAVVVASGWLPTRVARVISRHRAESIRLVLCGRKAGQPPACGGVLVQCRHFQLPAHPSRLTTLLPLNAGGAGGADGSQFPRWQQAERRAAALIGGPSRTFELGTSRAREMASALSRWASNHHHALLVVTSRRSSHLASSIREGLSEHDDCYEFTADDPGNPYQLALEHASQLIVTGESESMLADAARRSRPFVIWPLQPRPLGPWQLIASRIARQATAPRINRRGSIRPQQGSTYLCARLIERGIVLPPRDLESLHQALFQSGMARPFGRAIDGEFSGLPKPDRIIGKIAGRLGIRLNAECTDSRTENRHGHQS